MATLNLSTFPEPEHADCPKCGEQVKLYDPAGSEYCVCTSCHSLIQFTDGDQAAVVKHDLKPVTDKPLFALGSEGTLKERKFKVTAYLEKKEQGSVYTWKEYLIYNYEKGYATLAEFNGHWSFIVGKEWEPALAEASGKGRSASYNGAEYRVFNKYTPAVTALIGEFDWNVLDDHPNTVEFVRPPYILSEEKTGAGKAAEYFVGEYIEPEELAAAFGVDLLSFPSKTGIGANQPSKHYTRFLAVAKLTLMAIAVILIFQTVISYQKPERELLNQDFDIRFDSVAAGYSFKPFITPSFDQPDGKTALEIEVGSAVDNNWLEATIVLVNESSNQTWEITKGIEYYHDTEGGESWSEGSKRQLMVLPGIPKGKYHLNVYPMSGDPNQTNLYIRIVANITLWRNLVLTLLALSIYPLWCFFAMINFEQKRWMNSDYSPYETEE